MKKLFLIALSAVLSLSIANAQIINTVIGNGIKASDGNGGQATAASIDNPVRVIIDKDGNMYIAEPDYNDIRKISKTGIITKFAGTGSQGFSGDSGPASAAQFYYPSDLGIDDSGNIYVMDAGNYRVRKINTSGIITTIAGNGIAGTSGNGGNADVASIDCGGIDIDDSGNIYIAQSYQNNVRKINKKGIIYTIAGNGLIGYSGDGGPATNAEFDTPVDVSTDSKGDIYIADEGNDRVREIDKSGIIRTIAGNGTVGYSGDGGAADSAQLSYPNGMTIDAKGNVYIADLYNNVVRLVTASTGVITTFAGNGMQGYGGDGGAADSAELYYPTSTTLDSAGNLYIADYDNYVVRMVAKGSPEGILQINSSRGASIYPNPSNGIFTLDLKGISGKANIIVYNSLGQNIYNGYIMSGKTEIDLNAQPAGVYLYRILTADGSLVSTGKLEIK